MKEKIKTALKFLKSGQSFTIGEIRISIEENETINVIGWSQCISFKSITREQSIYELQEIKELFYKMVLISNELKEFLNNKKIVFSLYFDDYGKGSIEICSELDEVLSWKVNIKE